MTHFLPLHDPVLFPSPNLTQHFLYSSCTNYPVFPTTCPSISSAPQDAPHLTALSTEGLLSPASSQSCSVGQGQGTSTPLLQGSLP